MKSSIRPPNSWPAWTNPAIVLYHGTLLSQAEAIADEGINPSVGRARTDFGRGFYTTTMLAGAEIWSTKRVKEDHHPAVVKLTLNREALGSLHAVVFLRGSLDAVDYWSLVAHSRAGYPQDPVNGRPYDVAYGPVARFWQTPAQSAVYAEYDQISFHSDAARTMLNDKSVCTIEVLP